MGLRGAEMKMLKVEFFFCLLTYTSCKIKKNCIYKLRSDDKILSLLQTFSLSNVRIYLTNSRMQLLDMAANIFWKFSVTVLQNIF